MKLKIPLPLAQAFCVAMCLLGCVRNPSGEKVFRLNAATGVASLDPAFARDQYTIWATAQLYSTLIQLDSNLHPQPMLAKSWAVSDSGRCYTFVLRNDVWFAPDACFEENHRKLVAADVAYSLQRLIAPQTASPGAWVLNDKLDTTHIALQAQNDTTFILRLRRPFPPLLGMLAMQYTSIVPHEAVEKYSADFRMHPVGTGPFQFMYWRENEALMLAANPAYFEGKPKIDGVLFTFVPDAQTVFTSLLNGEVDMVSGLDGAYKDAALTLYGNLAPEFQKRIRMQTGAYLNTEYIGLRCDTAPFNSESVRRSCNASINKQDMLRVVRRNVGQPGNGTLVPISLKSNWPKTTFSAQDAKKAPVLKAFSLHLTAASAELGEYVQHVFAAKGTTLHLEQTTGASLRQMMAKGEAQAFRASWIADYPDAENYFSLFISKNIPPNGPNYTHFSNVAYDRLYETAMQCSDDAKRNTYYARMDSILSRGCPVIPLYYDQVTRFVLPRVHGLPVTPQNALDLRRVWLD